MIYLLILFLADFFVSLKVGIEIGYLWSVVWILLSALLGVALLRFSPYAIMGSVSTFSFGLFDAREAHNAAFSYLGGSIMLIVPGVLSDLLGLLLLLYTLYLHLSATIRQKRGDSQFANYEGGDENVIDVEIVDDCRDDDTAL